MSSYNIIYTTFSSLEDAKKLAHAVVKSRLAACANILPSGLSVYEWEGEIKEDAEYVMLIKTRRAQVEKLKQYIGENHPYEIPALFSIDIANVDERYKEWLDTQTS